VRHHLHFEGHVKEGVKVELARPFLLDDSFGLFFCFLGCSASTHQRDGNKNSCATICTSKGMSKKE
jgi:hypothetical protein